MAETKKRVRGGHRASTTRMVTQVNALVEESAPDSAKLLQLKHSLEEKLSLLDNGNGGRRSNSTRNRVSHQRSDTIYYQTLFLAGH